MEASEAFNKAIAADRAGDKATAFALFHYAAGLGMADAQWLTGYYYEKGWGVAQNMAQAAWYFEMAAAQGNATAQNSAGLCYLNGTGVRQDYRRAAEYFRQAAEQGDAAAQCNLGHCFEYGLGVDQNRDLALTYYQFSMDQGWEKAEQEYYRLMEILDEEDEELQAAIRADIEEQHQLWLAEQAAASADPLDEALAELNSLVGLRGVKEQVQRLINRMKVNRARAARGLRVPATTNHCVFTGNPGTGKTTVARIMAKVYKALDVVSQGQLVECDRSGLVGEYIGQTATKTKAVIEGAIGGVLFIDEAYALVGKGKNDFGGEAIEVLLKMMEDNRDDLVVIAAGYKKEMEAFISANPGLESRFQNFIEFEDYDAGELVEIFSGMCDRDGYVLSGGARSALGALFSDMVANKSATFANGREARKAFDWIIDEQAARLGSEFGDLYGVDTDTLATLTAADVEAAARRMSR